MSEPVEVVPVVDVDRPTECTAADCSQPVKWRALCQLHYNRQYAAERRAQRVAELVAELVALLK